jgi:hypothetical protein
MHAEGGPLIRLALEPEPHCMLETSFEALAWFRAELLSRSALAHMIALTGLSPSAAEAAIREHLGLCLDLCHAAVEFESVDEVLALLSRAELRIAKVQVTAGLRVAPVDAAAIAALRRFAEPVYLHQVVAALDEGELLRFLDLPDAIAAWEQGEHRPREWRVHFHVPVFQRELPPLRSTAELLEPLLHELLARRACTHYELETYTWDVLPAEHRAVPLDEAIARELRWVLERA